ncbi:MAG: dTMP kinase [Methanobacteriota archaeon]
MASRGPLVTLEGIDGSGKSTLAPALAAALRRDGFDVFETREPTRGPFGEAVRRALRDGGDPWVELFLFFADHREHLARVEAERARGRLVLSDRWSDSCFAYQGASLADELVSAGVKDPVRHIAEFAAAWDREPDVAFLLDLPVDAALARLGDRAALERFERSEFLAAVRENYLRRGRDRPYFHVLDGTRPTAALVTECVAKIRRL